MIVCTPLSTTLSQNQNYRLTYRPRVPFSDAENLSLKNTCEVGLVVEYFDGLGRPAQTIQVKGSADGTKDLVQPFAYDQFGREARKYLSYASPVADGSYKTDAVTTGEGVFKFYNPTGSSGNQLSNGVVRTLNPVAESRFEASPLSRLLEQGSFGEPWQLALGHTLKSEQLINDVEEVILYPLTPVSGASYKMNIGYGYAYTKGTLFKTITKDENWQISDGLAGTTEEFKDK